MLVHKAKQIVLVSPVHHAPAKAGELLQHLGYILSGLVSRPGLRICEERRRKNTRSLGVLDRLFGGLRFVCPA